jgi:hypothetical protein
VVADGATVEDEVAVPGLSLETIGEPLLEAADDSGASGEKGSMSAINPTRSGAGSDGRREAGFCDRRAVAQVIGEASSVSVADGLDLLDELPQTRRRRRLQGARPGVLAGSGTSTLHLRPLRGVEQLAGNVSGFRAVAGICNDTVGNRSLD